MKKVGLILLALMFVFAITGCSGSGDDEQGLTVEEGILKVGMDLQYPPFETFDADNNPTGVSVDVAQAFADELGLELKVVNMDFGGLIAGLELGTIDIAIASMSITEEREVKVDFSNPYFYFKIIALLNKDYATEKGLDGDSTAEELWAIKDTKFKGIASQISTTIPEANGFDVSQSADKSTAIMEVTLGKADILIMSPEVVINANKANPDTTVVFYTAIDVSHIGMAVVEGNSQLLEKANDFIAGMDDDDGVYDMIRDKYDATVAELFGSDIGMDFYIYED